MAKSEKNIFMTRVLLFAGLTIMILLFILSGLVSYSTMRVSTNEILEKVESLDSARIMQIEFQEQFALLSRMMNLQGDDIKFNEKFHRFSYYHSSIKDIIGNLRINYVLNAGVRHQINELDNAYDRVYFDYVSYFSYPEFAIVDKDISSAERILEISGRVAEMIEQDVESGINLITNRYPFVMAGVLGVLSFFSISLGVFLSLRLSKITSSLDEAVKKRTEQIKKEAEAHKETAIKLENSLSEISSTKERIEISEKKYRHFVEDSGDFIFVLDSNFIFTDFNKTICKNLKLRESELKGMSFFNIINKEGLFSTEKELVRAKMYTFMKKLNSIKFETGLMSSGMLEPLEVNVSFEKIQNGDKIEILGKASKKAEAILQRFFISETCEFEIGNKLLSADDVSSRIVMNLNKYLPQQEVNKIRIGIRELIINAIEHGNLNISFEEKSKAVEQGDYIRFLSEKGKQPGFRHKKIKILFSLNISELKCVIKDSGNGFDHQKILKNKASDINNKMLAHGRGIMMAKNIFDSVDFNQTGNEVTVLKKIR